MAGIVVRLDRDHAVDEVLKLVGQPQVRQQHAQGVIQAAALHEVRHCPMEAKGIAGRIRGARAVTDEQRHERCQPRQQQAARTLAPAPVARATGCRMSERQRRQ
jgi:hypothetical protein